MYVSVIIQSSRITPADMSTFKRIILMFVFPALAITAGVIWYALGARFVTTNNAYVKTDMISISTDIDGRVTSVNVADNGFVKKGQLMFTLDAKPFEIAIRKAEAKLKSIRLEVDSMHSQYAQALSRIQDGKQRVAFQKKQFERQQDLFNRGVGSVANLDSVSHDLDRARQDLLVSNEQARQALVELGGKADLPFSKHPMFLEALAAKNETELLLDYTRVVAPADGIATRMLLQPGEWVEQGRPIFNLVGRNNLRIEANLKETQLTNVNVGQSVDINVDAYPEHQWKGVVTHISAATGSEFMVLPPQNATGNWIKVVQRIPVIIELQDAGNGPSLRAGMTVEVSIDTVQEDQMLTAMRQSLASILPK